MARHPKRKFNLRKVRVAISLSIGSLAAFDVNTGNITVVSTNPYRIVSADLSWSLTDLATVSNDGFEFGLAHGDYSAAEVEECLEAGASIDPGDLVSREQANRLVRTVGIAGSGAVTDGSLIFNDGMPVKTKLNWPVGIGDAINLFIRNGSDTTWGSGTNIKVFGHIWIKDGL
jgi:hypothetical protein